MPMQKKILLDIAADGRIDATAVNDVRAAFDALVAALQRAGLKPRASMAIVRPKASDAPWHAAGNSSIH